MNKAILGHLASMCEGPAKISIVSIESISEDAVFVEFEFDGRCQGAVYYPQDNILFTPDDWKGEEATKDTIEDFRWIGPSGDEAIVVHGLPRLFSAYREEYRKAFGKRVRALREEKGISQTQLSVAAGILQPNIARIESGRYNCTIDTAARLSAALGEEL